MAKLPLPPNPRTTVFRAIDTLIRTDTRLAGVFSRPGSIVSWTGKKNVDDIVPRPEQAPWMRLTPTGGPDYWGSPDLMRGFLYVNVEMLVDGYDADDEMNLWWAVCRALYPQDSVLRNRIQDGLRTAGAWTGLCEFSAPAFDPQPTNGCFVAVGQIRCEVRLQLNT